MEKTDLLNKIIGNYLISEKFNGYPLSTLGAEKEKIIALVKKGKIEINFGDKHPNPHIKAFELDDKQIQIRKISNLGLENSCAYPTKEVLKTVVDTNKFRDKPFTLKIALGEPVLNFAPFDLRVLEFYRNDPRYRYSTDDISGFISICDEYNCSTEVRESDKILLQSFGFCYEKQKLERAVAVFYCYLAMLTPEHQKIWHSKLLPEDYFLHPNYEMITLGHFPEEVPIFTAFVEELYTINEFSKLIGRPNFFKNDYKENMPKEFGFLIRPTRKEFISFVHLLDKMISDNINKEFFKKNEVTQEVETKRSDGKITISHKGTITLLEEWLKKFRSPDPQPKIEMIKSFRKIREMRGPIAHEIKDDVFDQKYFKEQRDLIIEAYKAIRTLRLILANYPLTKSYNVPDWLFKGKICTF